MIKKNIFSFLLLLLLFNCQNSSNNFDSPFLMDIKVSFNYSNIPDGEVFYLHKYLIDSKTKIIDSCVKRKSKLIFKTKSDESFLGVIIGKKNHITQDFIVTNDPILIEWDERNTIYTQINGGENKLYYKNKLIFKLQFDIADEISDQISKYDKVSKNNKYYDYWFNYEIEFSDWISKNENYYSLIKLCENRNVLSNSTILKSVNFLKTKFKEHSLLRYLNDYVAKRKKNQIGGSFMNFPILDKNKKTVMLENVFHSNKEKYVIDFGASWCKYCIVEARELNRNYSKIDTAKVQIISLSIDTDFDKWIKYDKKEQYKWKNYIVKNIDENFSSNVSIIPAYFILDKNKKIIGKFNSIDSIPFLKF